MQSQRKKNNDVERNYYNINNENNNNEPDNQLAAVEIGEEGFSVYKSPKVKIKKKFDFIIKESLLDSLTLENKDLLTEFEGSLYNFIEKCEEYIASYQNINSLLINEEFINNKSSNNLNQVNDNAILDVNSVRYLNQQEIYDGKLQNLNKDNELNGDVKKSDITLESLVNNIFDYIKERGNLYYDEKFNSNFHKSNKDIIIENVVEQYLKDEVSFIENIKSDYSNNKQGNKKNSPQLLEEEDANEYNTKKIKKDLKSNIIGIVLTCSEPFFISVLVYISFILFNIDDKINISSFSNFNKKVSLIFDENASCNQIFLKITSPSALEEWLTNCYIETYDFSYFYFRF